MCTYNGEKYIRQQLDSILQQTYPIHEIIINDDISTDKTVDISSLLMMIYQQTKLLI
ncbi:glycosyltransferase [Parabacteroides johnsonii]|uniref:glycosyltransferase n=1 Tax=Parabacteroides johnsonii TaxID=387661 RepID=UPI0035175912